MLTRWSDVSVWCSPALSGPPIIGDKAWWKFPKFGPICSDKISKICPNMFGLGQAFAKFFKSCSDGPSGLQNLEFCSDRPIWPPKTAILPIYQCYVLILEKNHLKKSLSTYPVSRHGSTSTLLASCYNGFDCHQYVWKVFLHRIENPDILVIKSKCSAILAECGW